MATITNVTTKIIQTSLKLYAHISRLWGPSCRFYPTCSAYCSDAVTEHGPAKGLLLTSKRLLKCHPWHPGGFDPVPKNANSYQTKKVST